jgi:hypothetical protein
VGGLGEESMPNLMDINESRKVFEVQVNSHYNSVCLTINYALILNFIGVYELDHIPLTNSGIYIGLIFGAALIYSFGSIILLSIQHVTPIVCFDLRPSLRSALPQGADRTHGLPQDQHHLQRQTVALANEIEMRLKDAIGSCMHGYITFTISTDQLP